MNTAELVGAIVASVCGSSLLTAIATMWFTRKKTEAEADTIVTDNAMKLLNLVQTRLEQVEAELLGLRKENIAQHLENAQLKLRVTTLEKELSKYTQVS